MTGSDFTKTSHNVTIIFLSIFMWTLRMGGTYFQVKCSAYKMIRSFLTPEFVRAATCRRAVSCTSTNHSAILVNIKHPATTVNCATMPRDNDLRDPFIPTSWLNGHAKKQLLTVTQTTNTVSLAIQNLFDKISRAPLDRPVQNLPKIDTRHERIDHKV